MLVAVVSDIHGNIVALEAVLADAGAVDAVWCLGDTVGYGPQPNACVRTVRDQPHAAVAGNHDWAAIGKIGIEEFNPYAAAAARWTSTQLSTEVKEYLGLLPQRRVEGEFTLVHGSPRDPIWEYVLDRRVAAANFQHFQTSYCLVGHTHVPSYFVQRGKEVEIAYAVAGQELELGEERTILNPGSVGQPRDRDPRAAYLLLDTGRRRAVWRRASYDIAATQRDMTAQRLPARLVERLTEGW
jgi:predicted phosphodiesterase